MNVGWTLRRIAKIAAVAVAVLPSLVQAFIPSVSDHIGSIRALVDATSGETVAEYEYDPYGVLLEEAGEKADVCPFRFSGKYYDPETQLLYFGYRYYNPVSTKWLTVDPLQERGGLNFTAYCGGDPVNQVDPLGLYWQRNANGKWEWVSGSSGLFEDMVSPGIDTIAQIGQAVPDIWSGFWEVLQNTRIPESQGNGFVSTTWNNVASAGNAILAPLAIAAEPRPQDNDDGLLMFGEACFGSGRGFGDRLKLGGLGAFVFVGSAFDVVHFVPDPVDAMQKSARETGLDILRRSSRTTKGDGLNWVTEIPKGSRPHPANYMSVVERKAHADLFERGVVRISPSVPSGPIGRTETWVFPRSIVDDLRKQSDGNVAKLEELLGFDAGDLGKSPVLIQIPSPKSVRIPSGNEFGASYLWRPGGRTIGGIPEAIIDPVPVGSYTTRPFFGK